MIYSKPFPDGTIKTRGSDFGSVSWSHWGADREWRGLGMWQGLHVPWGRPAGDSRILNSAGELGLSRAPTRAPGCQVPSVPRGAQVPSVPQSAQHCCCPCCRKCVWGSNASKQSRVPALIRSSLESGVPERCAGGRLFPAVREGPWPGRRSSCPGSGWGQAGGQRSFSGWRSVTLWVPHPASHLAFFLHSRFIYL